MLELKDLREKRHRLSVEAGDILTKAAEDGRECSAEELAKWNAIHVDIDRMGETISARERQAELETRLQEPTGRKADPGQPGGEDRSARPGADPRRRVAGQRDAEDALRAWFMTGAPGAGVPREYHEAAKRSGLDLNASALQLRLSPVALRGGDPHSIAQWEQRAAQTVTTSGGGYTIPDEAMRALEVALLEFGGVRQVANVIRTDSGADLPIPTTNDTSNKGAILGINTQVTDVAIAFGQTVLNSYKYTSKLILVPIELLQDSSVNWMSFVAERLAERIGRITNDHFTTGTGANEPNGVVTASTLGKTGATGQTATIIYNDLVDLEHALDPSYRGRARFMMSDALLKVIKKLVDGASRPLWMPGLTSSFAVGAPDTILGYPYTINQSMATPQASAKTLLFGDFSKYYVRDAMNVELLRLNERYADYHQVGFIAVSRHDGDLIDAGTHPVVHYAHPAS